MLQLSKENAVRPRNRPTSDVLDPGVAAGLLTSGSFDSVARCQPGGIGRPSGLVPFCTLQSRRDTEEHIPKTQMHDCLLHERTPTLSLQSRSSPKLTPSRTSPQKCPRRVPMNLSVPFSGWQATQHPWEAHGHFRCFHMGGSIWDLR